MSKIFYCLLSFQRVFPVKIRRLCAAAAFAALSSSSLAALGRGGNCGSFVAATSSKDAANGQGSSSAALTRYLRKYRDRLGAVLLECALHGRPLVVPAKNLDTHIFYWGTDSASLEALRQLPRMRSTQLTIQQVSLPELANEEVAEDFARQVYMKYREVGLGASPIFNTVVVSDVLNFVDAASFLPFIAKYQRHGDHIFIGNTIDLGSPDELHPGRPKSNEEIKNHLIRLGYEVLEESGSGQRLERHGEYRLVARKIQEEAAKFGI